MASDRILTDPLMMPTISFMAISSEFEITDYLATIIFLFFFDFI